MNIPIGAFGADAVRELHESIKEFNRQASAHTTTLVRLTWAITALTAVMLIAVFVQVAVAFKQIGWL